LDGNKPADAAVKTHGDLFIGEWTTGIGIDPVRQTQDGERIYSAEYLRLRPGVRLGFAASLPMKQNGPQDSVQECIGQLLTADRVIVVGGQQRVCSVEPENSRGLSQLLPRSAGIEGTRVKWILLTPALFPAIEANPAKGITAHHGGWLPNWIDPTTGQVLLKNGDTGRAEGESREAWRQRVRTLSALGARLVAARIPKAVPITGWTEAIHLKGTTLEREHGARPTHLAVPAGAVYYFEATTQTDAENLAAALNWHGSESDPTTIKNRRSTLLGEKGFGLGVCGTWQFYGDVHGRSGK
jgi:hypothetical protein